MNQLQLSEMVFALNTRIQPNDTGSPISAADTTIVSYNLDIEGLLSTRHRKFLRKIVNFPNEDEAAEEPVMNADKRVVKAGQDRSLFTALPGSSLG